MSTSSATRRRPAPVEAGRSWSPGAGDELSALVDLEIEEMAAAWRRGERPTAEDFLAGHPELRDEDAIRLIYEEYCIRRECGDGSASNEVFRRFPRWKSKLALLFDCDRLLRDEPAEAADFPEVGEDLGDFRLLAEIGRGAQGRTYLAHQRSLAHRAVVLKVAPLGHDEHLSLARLQHMHIVPLYFEQVFPDRGCRIMGMPYLGGTTLSRIGEALHELAPEERNGRRILAIVDGAWIGGKDEPRPSGGPYRPFMAKATAERAVCWIGACLAQALQYAHDRGLVHMDVKGSNVLIAGDCQPMLLDFHLARAPIDVDSPPPDRLGGTPGYMSPEQRAAMEAIRAGREVATPVDGRTDIYSLGLMMYEALGGRAATPAIPLRRVNPQVSLGLADVLRRCMAHDPADRYPDAASLAADLRRHLADLPLRGVANRSLRERWGKWRRRRPAGWARATLATLVMIVAAVVGSGRFIAERARAARVAEALRIGRDHLASGRYDAAVAALKTGLAAADAQGGREISATLIVVMQAQAADRLHALVERIRFRYGLTPAPPEEAVVLATRIDEVWSLRSLFAERTSAAQGKAADAALAVDFLDLAAIRADFLIQGARPADRAAALAQAIQFLGEAEEQFGVSPAVRRDLRRYSAELAGRPHDDAGSPPPRTAWEHYDLGRSLLRSRDYQAALVEFRRSVELQPSEFWPNYFEGVCALRMGRHQDAVSAFSICAALSPRRPEPYDGRARAYEALGSSERAAADDARADSLRTAPADR